MPTALKSWYKSLTDVRREELKPLVLMLLYGFLVMTSYYVIKPARNAMFVDRIGSDNLPYVYIAAAVVVSLVMIGYSRWVQRVKPVALILGTFAFLAGCLVLFRWLLLQQTFLISGVFYVWGKLYPLLVVSQFYLVGNLLFTTRQAKRLFGPIGVGLILGGIAGSSVAGWATDAMGTENLLLVAAGILGACALLVVALAPDMGKGEGSSGSLVGNLSGDAVKLLKESSHLRWIAIILMTTILVTTLTDWQFNTAVDHFIQGEDGKTAFFGRFYLILNIVSVIIQVFFTSFVLRKWGVGVALLALPLGLLGASVAIFLVPTLITGALVKAADGTLRYSLDQSTRELLYLPVPTDVKYKVKPLIDLAVYRGGTGLGGILLLVFTNGLGFGLRGVAVIAAVLIAFWIAATFRMKREFKNSVKRLIGIQEVGLAELIARRLDEETSEGLRRSLQGEDEDEIVYSLGLARHRDLAAFSGELRELLHHESPEVRARALVHLTEIADRSCVPEARALLVDPDLDVRVAAMEYVCRLGTDDPEQELLDALADEAFGVRAAAIAVILRHGGSLDETAEPTPLRLEALGQERGADALEALSGEEDLEARVYAARLLVEADLASERGRRVMELLLDDPDDSVRHAALQAAAQSRRGDFLPLLVDRLEVPRDRNAAVRALQRRAPEIRDLLLEKLRDADAPLQQRLSIPKILRETADQETVDALVDVLSGEDESAQVRFEILKTLGKLRRDRSDLDFEGYDVDALSEREAREAYLWARRLRVVAGEPPDATFLGRILEQRMEEAAERAFRVLGLRHDLADLEAAFVALRSDDDLMRQRGFELVENALPRRERDLFDPLLNPERSWKERAAAAEERFGAPEESREEILEALAGEDALSVSTLARVELTGEPVEGVLTPEELREAMASRISLVLDEPYIEEAVRIMDILDRADVLRKTDVFRELRGEELAGIAALMDEVRAEEGDPVGTEGSTGQLVVVVRGRAVVRRGERVLHDAGPGEVLVAPGFLDGRPADSESVAVEDSVLLTLPRPAFQRLLEERFTVVRGLLAHLAAVLREEGRGGPGEAPEGKAPRREKETAAAD